MGGKGKLRSKRGLWKPEEDLLLKRYIETHGEGNWSTVSKRTGLMRGGRSCRLRWKNYLQPNLKNEKEMTEEEEDLIIRMHKLLGNRWSLIAGRLPGRTDNKIKNHWNHHLKKRCTQHEEAGSVSTNVKLNHLSDQPTCSTNPHNTSIGSSEEETGSTPNDINRSDGTWMNDMKSLPYDTPHDHGQLPVDGYLWEEHFMSSLDSTMWPESFGHTTDMYWNEISFYSHDDQMYPIQIWSELV